MRTLKLVAALSVAGAFSLASFVPVQAAPIAPLSAAAKPSAQDRAAIQVRWAGWGWGVGAGLLAGALVGAAIASPFSYGGYAPYYGYGYAYYGYPYGYSAAYYPYSYAYYRPWRRPYWQSYGMYRLHPHRRW